MNEFSLYTLSTTFCVLSRSLKINCNWSYGTGKEAAPWLFEWVLNSWKARGYRIEREWTTNFAIFIFRGRREEKKPSKEAKNISHIRKSIASVSVLIYFRFKFFWRVCLCLGSFFFFFNVAILLFQHRLLKRFYYTYAYLKTLSPTLAVNKAFWFALILSLTPGKVIKNKKRGDLCFQPPLPYKLPQWSLKPVHKLFFLLKSLLKDKGFATLKGVCSVCCA